MKKHCFLFMLMPLLILASCCSKVGCVGDQFMSMNIKFKGFTTSELKNIYIAVYNDSLEQSIYSDNDLSVFQNDSFAHLLYYASGAGPAYSVQNYFVVTTPYEKDTLGKFNYQISNHTINCNHCPGERDNVSDVNNFSFTFKNQTFTTGDTVVLSK